MKKLATEALFSTELARRRARLAGATLCSVCGRATTNFPPWDKHRWACRPCWNGYVAFRRAYKAEHGVYPTINEFREDETPTLGPPPAP